MDIGIGEVDPDAQLRPLFIFLFVFVETGVAPNLLPLVRVVPNLVGVDVDARLEDLFLTICAELDNDVLARVLDVEHYCFVPDRLGTLAHIRLRH